MHQILIFWFDTFRGGVIFENLCSECDNIQEHYMFTKYHVLMVFQKQNAM